MTALDELRLHVDPPVVVLHVREGAGDWTLPQIKKVALLNPGGYRLALCVGRHTLALGERWNVDASRELAAGLEDFGRVEVLDAPDTKTLGHGAPASIVHPLPRRRRRRR